jgi:thiol-disulfide isomerase/thioredoxin
MRISFLLAAAAFAAGLPVVSSAAEAPAASQADRDYDAIMNAKVSAIPADPAARALAIDRIGIDRYNAVEKFFADHPSDPRRWVLLNYSTFFVPQFLTGFAPGTATKDSPGTPIADGAAKAAWQARFDARLAAMGAATDVPAGVSAATVRGRIAGRALDAEAKLYDGSAGPKSDDILGRIDAFAAAYPDDTSIMIPVGDYLAARLHADPDADLAPVWKRFAASPSKALRIKAALSQEPMALEAFTAVDGRKVDLASLRGKVVLIDYWSTMCHPCVAELPDLKKVYEKYHDKGFEIIGIAMQGDPGEPASRLTDFLKENQVPWPQYCDMKRWKTAPAVQYGVNCTPTNFLLDQNGRMVAYGDLYHILAVPDIERRVAALLAAQPAG